MYNSFLYVDNNHICIHFRPKTNSNSLLKFGSLLYVESCVRTPLTSHFFIIFFFTFYAQSMVVVNRNSPTKSSLTMHTPVVVGKREREWAQRYFNYLPDKLGIISKIRLRVICARSGPHTSLNQLRLVLFIIPALFVSLIIYCFVVTSQ